MKRNIFIIALFAVTLLASTSCWNNSNKKETTEVAETYKVEALMENAETLAGQAVTIEGVCTHLCRHGAKKMFILGDSVTVRVESGELGSFPQECINANVQVTGTLVEDRIDEAYLAEWEAQVAANTAEEHGDEEEGGCAADKAARNEQGNSINERIQDFRAKIADRKAKEGKEYLSFYHVLATSYEIK